LFYHFAEYKKVWCLGGGARSAHSDIFYFALFALSARGNKAALFDSFKQG
jgi:hypothetical protein